MNETANSGKLRGIIKLRNDKKKTLGTSGKGSQAQTSLALDGILGNNVKGTKLVNTLNPKRLG